MTTRRALFISIACIVALITTACGPRYETSDQTSATGDGLSAIAGNNELGGNPSVTTPRTQTGTGQAVAQPGTSSGTPIGPGAVPGDGSTAGQTYRGVTATKVTIGVMASQTINEAITAFGAEGGAFPDPVKQVEPIVKWINANGGVAGRQLEILWHFRDDLSPDTDDSKSQEACTDFTQDKKVFLVTSIYQGHGFAPCLADSDIPTIESGAGPSHHGIKTYDEIGGYYMTPNQISMDRYSASLIDGIADRGFFKGDVRVGLIYMGYPYAHAAVERTLKPALKRLGVTLVDEQELRPIERASDFAGTQAEVSNAVLRFKQQNINRLISLEDQATTIMAAAEQQEYYPRYGLGSGSLFGAAGSNPDSMKDSTIVGSNVPLDVLPRYRGEPNAAEKRCRKIYLDSRQAPEDELAWGLMELHCEGFFFIKAVLDRVSLLSPKGLISTVETIGSAYQPITVYGMKLARGRYDGASKARPLKFIPDCTCIKYAGPAYSIP